MKPAAADYPTLFDIHPTGTEPPIAQRKITPGCLLPAPDNLFVDATRAALILDVSYTQLRVMLGAGLLAGYQINRRNGWKVLYSSIVQFCDGLRVKYHIADRRARRLAPGMRWRDAELLPFPKEDTVSVDEAMVGFGFSRQRVIHLLEEGKVDAYQLYGKCAWRISKSSLFAFRDRKKDELGLPASVSNR